MMLHTPDWNPELFAQVEHFFNFFIPTFYKNSKITLRMLSPAKINP